MFLTGFDSPRLNTLYVDKNLRYHGLVQAFSRTNRILNDRKSQGNIICFRNLKEATDEAIALFSNKDAKETVLVEPYEDYVTKFNKASIELLTIAPTVNSVDALPDEKAQLAFVTKFRELMRLKNVLTTFAEFKDADLALEPQKFEDYKSKYLDLHDSVKKKDEKESSPITIRKPASGVPKRWKRGSSVRSNPFPPTPNGSAKATGFPARASWS